MATKVNSKFYQTSEMELFPQVFTGFRGELRILPNVWDGAFCKNSETLKAAIRSLLLQKPPSWMFEYAPELAAKVRDVSF